MKRNGTIEETDNIVIDNINVSAYTIPTDYPESDGTLEWSSTTLVLAEITANGKSGIGYTYADAAAAYFIERTLKPLLQSKSVQNIPETTGRLIRAIRNNGSCGIAMMAVSAVDNALWDLKAKVIGLPLCDLFGCVRAGMLLYGSGGFTSYTEKQTARQFGAWAAQGITHFKMKIGRDKNNDLQRVKAARGAIGRSATLMVDANGAYTVKEALEMAAAFAEYNVNWMEEPVSSDDLRGLRFIRDHAPAGCSVVAGEYGYNIPYFEAMLRSGAVDVLQADATRCGGISLLLKAGYLCEGHQLPFSTHCAPSLHLHASLTLPAFGIAEYFHDHVRVESILFDGVSPPVEGCLMPDRSRPGLGLTFKHADAKKYKL